MSRSRQSAKAAGARFERVMADALKEHVSEFIDRKVKTGARDQGDVANLRSAHNLKITAELKDVRQMSLSGWLREAEDERINAGDDLALVIAKRRGHADPLRQYVVLEVRDLIGLITGERPTITQKNESQP